MVHYHDLPQVHGPTADQGAALSLETPLSYLELKPEVVETLLFSVQNLSQQTSFPVEVSIFMPKGLLYVGAKTRGWICTQRRQVLHCIYPGLAPGEWQVLELLVAPTQRILAADVYGLEARLLNQPGTEAKESVWIDLHIEPSNQQDLTDYISR